MRQSSANSRVWDEVTHWGKSFKYTRNNNGPSTVPWGTPDVTGLVSDELPSRTTVWSRWERKVAATHSTRCLLKNEPWTYRKKLVNFHHLNGVHFFFCQSWYNIFFLRLSKYNFFFLRKSEYNFFFLKKPGPPLAMKWEAPYPTYTHEVRKWD